MRQINPPSDPDLSDQRPPQLEGCKPPHSSAGTEGDECATDAEIPEQ